MTEPHQPLAMAILDILQDKDSNNHRKANRILFTIRDRLPKRREDFWVNRELVTIEQATKKGIIYGHNSAVDEVIKLLEE